MDKESELWSGFEESARFNVEEFLKSVKQSRDPRPLVAFVNATQSLLNLMVVQLAQEGSVLPEQVQRLAGANIGMTMLVELVKEALTQDDSKEKNAEQEEALKKKQDEFLAHLLVTNR